MNQKTIQFEKCDQCRAIRPLVRLALVPVLVRKNCHGHVEPHWLCTDQDCAAKLVEKTILRDLALCE